MLHVSSNSVHLRIDVMVVAENDVVTFFFNERMQRGSHPVAITGPQRKHAGKQVVAAILLRVEHRRIMGIAGRIDDFVVKALRAKHRVIMDIERCGNEDSHAAAVLGKVDNAHGLYRLHLLIAAEVLVDDVVHHRILRKHCNRLAVLLRLVNAHTVVDALGVLGYEGGSANEATAHQNDELLRTFRGVSPALGLGKGALGILVVRVLDIALSALFVLEDDVLAVDGIHRALGIVANLEIIDSARSNANLFAHTAECKLFDVVVGNGKEHMPDCGGAQIHADRLGTVDNVQVLAVRGRRPRRTGPMEHERFQACLGSNVPQLLGAATARVEAVA